VAGKPLSHTDQGLAGQSGVSSEARGIGEQDRVLFQWSLSPGTSRQMIRLTRGAKRWYRLIPLVNQCTTHD
jgi:hypothetical protein